MFVFSRTVFKLNSSKRKLICLVVSAEILDEEKVRDSRWKAMMEVIPDEYFFQSSKVLDTGVKISRGGQDFFCVR